MSYQKKPLLIRGAIKCAEQPNITLASAAFVVMASIAAPSYAADAPKKSPSDAKADVTQLEGVTTQGQKAAPGSNPYANPQAPYKAERSANTKLTAPLKDTPKTITVVGKEQMQDAGVSALKELMRTQPGVTLGIGEGGDGALGDRFSIRGFEVRGDIFTDGIRDIGQLNRELFATEQVEITKGANSTVAGRGTTGGTVNIIGKKPQEEHFTKATVTAGNENRATIDANRVGKSGLKLRTNAMVQKGDVPGRNHVDDQRQGLAIAAEMPVSDKTTLVADYYLLRTDGMPDRGIPWDYNKNTPAAVDRNNFYGFTNRDFQKTKADVLTLGADMQINQNTSLSHRTRVGETGNDYVGARLQGISTAVGNTCNPANAGNAAICAAPIGPGSVIRSDIRSADFNNKVVTSNTQLNREFHVGNTEHQLAAGFEFGQEEVTNQPYSYTNGTGNNVAPGTSSFLNVLNPNNTLAVPVPTGRDVKNKVNIDTNALYVMDTVKIGDKWEVSAGLRHDSIDIDRRINVNAPNANDAKKKTSKLNGSAGVVYKLNDNGRVYASAGTSSNVPGEVTDAVGSILFSGLTPAMAAFKPEENRTVELGTKWDVAGGAVGLTAAVFQTEKKNKIEVNTANAASQTGTLEVKGVEFGASGNLTPKLSLSGGVTLIEGKVKQSAVASNVGRKLANTPEQTAAVQVKYQATPQLAVGGTVVHKGKFSPGAFAAQTAPAGTPHAGKLIEVPEANQLDLMAEYKVNKKLGLQLNVKNALDETNYEGIYHVQPFFVTTNPGRSTAVSLSYDF